jgi:hypothetical protein
MLRITSMALGASLALSLAFALPAWVSAQGISQLQLLKSTSTPYSAITTNIDGQDIYMPRGDATTSSIAARTICLINDVCRTTWPGSGTSFSTTSTDYWYSQNRDFHLSGGYLTPTTTLTVRFPQGFISVGSSTIVGNATTTGSHSVGSLITTLNGERFTDLTGTGLTISSNALTLDATGDWTGTLDGIEGASFVQTSRQLSVAGTANQITSSAGAQTLAADRTWTLSLPSHVIFPSSFVAPLSSTTNATSTNHTVTGNFIVEPLTSALVLTGSGGAFAEYAGASCTNQFVRSLSALGAATCATVTASDVSLADLTATNSTLTFSGTYNGSTARTIGLNLANANTWTALQHFTANASTTQLSVAQIAFFGSATSTFTASGALGVATTSPYGLASIEQGTESWSFWAGNIGSTTPSFAIGGVNQDGRIGIATSSASQLARLALGSGSLLVYEGQPATTTSITVNWAAGNQQNIRLGTAGTTISFTNYSAGQKLVLTICNPGSAAGAITWGTQILWPAGTAPAQTTTADKCDVWSFLATQGTSTLKVLGSQSANF